MTNDIFKQKIHIKVINRNHKKRITAIQNLKLHTYQISDIKKELKKYLQVVFLIMKKKIKCLFKGIILIT